MATLQSSGAISLSQVQAVMGGANPISLSEYYRGGAYVPATKSVSTTVYEPTSGYYYTTTGGLGSGNPNSFWWLDAMVSGPTYPPIGYDPAIAGIRWFGTYISYNVGNRYTTSYTSGGYTYERGPYQVAYSSSDGLYGPYHTTEYYSVRRWYVSTSTISINTGVPSSGTISLSNLYGAEKP